MVELLGLLLTALVFAIPGIVLSFALFTGTKFNKLDRLLAGLILGIIAAPLLGFMEYFIGLKLGPGLVFANNLIVLVVGIALLYFRGYLKIFSPSNMAEVVNRELEAVEKAPLHFVAPAALVLIVLFGFLLRIAFTFITNFFEFDPYYYTFLTEMLVKHGAIPLSSDISYFPLLKFHHEPALVQYIAGSWNLVYNLFTGIAYDKPTLILITNIYPPLVGALLSVLAYWMLREQYGDVAGIAGALFFATTPQLIQKFAAGVAELQPWGLFSALFIFTAYVLALRRNEWQFTLFAALATFSAIIGAVQSLWPVGIMSAFFLIQSVVNYYSGHNEKKLAFVAVTFSASVLAANVAYNLYANAGLLTLPLGMLLAVFSCVPAVVFFFASKNARLSAYSRHKLVAGLLVVGFLFSLLPILPGGKSVSSSAADFIDVTAAFAHYAGPLSRTIAEETPTDPGVLAQVFGILNPILLTALALILAWGGVEALLASKKNKAAAVFVLACLAVIFLRVPISDFADGFGASTGLHIVTTLGKLFDANELFAFMLVAILGTIIRFVYSKEVERNEAALLSVLVVYPVAYIGLNKVKFLLHLGFALAVGIGVLLGEIGARAKFIHEYFHVGSEAGVARKWTVGFALTLLIILGAVQAIGFPGKAPGALPSAQAQSGSQISQDWLDAMSWLKNNTSYNDPSAVARCKEKFGHDCRVISWWDYGHWTAFLGETKTVLDPGNGYEFFDQEVAHGFVDNEAAFMQSVEYHQATHVLVDFELVQKWGALVFLSGSCQRDASNPQLVKGFTCPDKRRIENWQAGPGQSKYELEHYFENLDVSGQCPYSQQMLLVKGSFGGAYCATQTELIPLDRNGLRTDLTRKYVPVNLLGGLGNLSSDVHYLLPLSQSSFVDANPDLRVAGVNSTVFNSVFTRLYFFENLPGYKLAYRSPHGEVKIFEKITAG